ncbi:Protein kinase, ATP binding site-containing protein [Artemisia annua]|uniref:Protein kinase, ATP binding site-containing protein n=1 Tax=Artemisia annua TaxID=35608 RepID=A0A2U1KHJ2_ARTAN|nr:Protein kinase, ATP binding site-containing protein [Artemisia annua]
MKSVTKQFEHFKIKLESIKLATNNFADANCIGKGGFGEVYKGELVHSKGHTVVALKRLNRKFGQGDPEFWKEIIMLSLYKHDNIVSLLGFCDESGEQILVYEYASRRSLDFSFGTHQRVLHRDIKSSNILLDENWNARISDMGLSKFGPANQQITFLVSDAVGTFGCCGPEYSGGPEDLSTQCEPRKKCP